MVVDDLCRSRSAPECLRAKSLSGDKFISLVVECKVYQPVCRNWQFAEAYHTTFGPKRRNLFLHVLLTITSKKRRERGCAKRQ